MLIHRGISHVYEYDSCDGGVSYARDRFKDHPYYQDAVDFCEKWDQKSFDPNYESYSLEYFEPKVRKLFSKEPNF